MSPGFSALTLALGALALGLNLLKRFSGRKSVLEESRDAVSVARRALCLAALAEIGEDMQACGGLEEAPKMRAWLAREGLLSELEPSERELVECTDWDGSDAFEAEQGLEAVHALLWAVGQNELAPLTEWGDTDGLPLDRPVADWIGGCRLRDVVELYTRTAILQLWVRRTSHSDGAEVVRLTEKSTLTKLIPIVDGDFAIGGIAFRHLGPEARRDIGQRAAWRHRALRWVLDRNLTWLSASGT